jgi:hypothetical protein
MLGPTRLQTRRTAETYRKTIGGFVFAMWGLVIARDGHAQALGATTESTTSDAPTSNSPSANEVVARLELDLPAGCGTQAWFVERVRVRSDKIRFRPEASSLVVDARIAHLPNGQLRATMSLRRRNGTVLTRTIKAGSCEQAIEALALVTAVTLDPSAVIHEEPERKTSGGELEDRQLDSKASTPATRADGETKSVETWSNARADKTKVLPSPDPDDVPKRPESHATRDASTTTGGPEWALDLSVLGHRGAAPGWLLGAELGLGLAFRRDSVVAPSLRLGLGQVQRSDVRAEGGLADFSLLLLTIEGCPLSARVAPFELRACAVIETGRMAASGHQTVQPEQHRRLWLAPGGGAEFSVRLAHHWSAILRGRSVFPLVRDTYQFAPEAFYETPMAVVGVQAGLSYRFR